MAVKYASNMDLDKGINKLLPSRKVVWTNGRNVRFTPGYVSKTLGKTLLATNPSGFPVRAVFTFIGTDGVVRSIVCCDNIIYSANADFTVFTAITPSPAPTGGASDVWQFELVGGLPILSNGKDAIWKWASYAGVLTALSGAPTWAKRISSCMNRLIVSNLSEGGYVYTGRVRWTEMGNPENWTIDLTFSAGRHDLMNYDSTITAFENIQAQQAIGHKLFLWSENKIWTADFSQAIRNFIRIPGEYELLGPKAVCQKKGSIYFAAKDDFYRFTGEMPEAIGAPIREDFIANLNESARATSYSFSPYGTKEIWFCVPTGDSTVPNTAYVYNYELGNWTILDVDFACHSGSNLAGVPRDIVGNSEGRILQFDSGFNAPIAGVTRPILGTIETGDMDLDAPDQMKRIAEVLLDLEVQTDISELMVQVGLRNRLADDITWSDPVPFTVGASDFCDFCDLRREGKYVRLRFYSDQLDSPWKMIGYTLKYEFGGTR